MSYASASLQPPRQCTRTSECSKQLSGVQDDDAVWMACINTASIEDARLIDGWTKIIDVTLVYVALLGGALTAFIIQTTSRFRPDPQDVTNQLLIAIYDHKMNPSIPIDFEKLLKLDDSKFKWVVFQSTLLYTSLAISVAVAAVAMVAKLWIIRYKHEVTASGPPRLRARRRQEVYDGAIAWRLDKCIEALPVMALIAVVLFALFIFSSISEEQKQLGYVVGVIFHLGLSFVLDTSITAAFISTSPFRSPFSDLVKFLFRIFPDQPNPDPNPELQKKNTRTRKITIIVAAVLVLAVTGYLVFKQIAVAVPLVYLPFAAVLALAREETEMDIQPRLYNLPEWVFFTTCLLFITCGLSFYFSTNPILFYILFPLVGIILGVQGFVVVKISQVKAKTADADAIAWLLSISPSQNPDWFEKAVQIAEGSPNLRARLLKALFPLLVPLIISTNKRDDEQKYYLNALADLVDFQPCKASVWRNRAAMEHPSLPPKLRERLEGLLEIQKCSHKNGNAKRQDNTERCPERCTSDAADVLIRVLGRDKGKQKERTIEHA